jgi:hypothetical protein
VSISKEATSRLTRVVSAEERPKVSMVSIGVCNGSPAGWFDAILQTIR